MKDTAFETGLSYSRVKQIRTFLLLLFFLASIFLPKLAHAASLYFSPSSGNYNVGQIFNVSVIVSSPDEAMNAASGVISFHRDALEVVSVNRSGSIIDLWVQEPSFSNDAGTVNFEGIVFNPGYQGSAGTVLNISFRSKVAGNISVSFSSGSVLANDGQGTNILKSLGSGSYVASVSEAAAPSDTQEDDDLSAPNISSDTHPDPDSWYAKNEAEFSWPTPSGVTAVRVLVSDEEEDEPTETHTPPISSYTASDLEDGIWYLHVQFRNSQGWGPVESFRFQVDTTEPEYFDITPAERDDPVDPKVRFHFFSYDKVSGISHYEVKINDGEFEEWEDDGSGIYETPSLSPGDYVLTARAVDYAGNYLEESVEFTVFDEDSLPVEVPSIWQRIKAATPLLLAGLAALAFSGVAAWIISHSLYRREKRINKKLAQRADLIPPYGSFAFVDYKEMQKYITMLEKARLERSLTKEEKNILKWIHAYMDGMG